MKRTESLEEELPALGLVEDGSLLVALLVNNTCRKQHSTAQHGGSSSTISGPERNVTTSFGPLPQPVSIKLLGSLHASYLTWTAG